MYSSAAFWTQLGMIIYGAKDLKRGVSMISSQILHPKTVVVSGVLEEKAVEMFHEFFLGGSSCI